MGPLVELTRKPLCVICRQIVLQAMNFAPLLFTLFSPLGKTPRLRHTAQKVSSSQIICAHPQLR